MFCGTNNIPRSIPIYIPHIHVVLDLNKLCSLLIKEELFFPTTIALKSGDKSEIYSDEVILILLYCRFLI